MTFTFSKLSRALFTVATLSSCAAFTATAAQTIPTITPKVLVVTMFGSEAQPWLEHQQLTQNYEIPGLSREYPALHCNETGLCMVTTAMGYANASATLTALEFAPQVDLTNSYIIIAGIGGVDPDQGTLGSAHWARYAIDGGLTHRIDARQMPKDWTTGTFALGSNKPGEKPKWSAGTEVFHLNDALVDKAYALSKHVALLDSDAADKDRQQFTDSAKAQSKPFVSICDTISNDTFWVGSKIAKAMDNYAATLTDGKANVCTTQMEDNASLTALQRGADADKLDFNRILVLRTASDFDQEAPGQTPIEALAANGSGYEPAEVNAYRVANAVASNIIIRWDEWQNGTPQ
ncbi:MULTISPECIES: purine-nucleoside phosphorylase [Vibrio]|uniref:Purine nucleoside permease n=2 Tax=Vibrio TaxID=662 RepID=A0A7X4LPU0_9VIBR|nr:MULTISPECIES: purine nucleoside permease [Vibrio]MBF9000637.1 purine nucleoside permease [Vibrio nitrifigilis]MZI95882.1 purine nucleoside permease [Vibrio eleionomae]